MFGINRIKEWDASTVHRRAAELVEASDHLGCCRNEIPKKDAA
jgi:hypothetical protein